jgi:hypothetical protein
MLRKTVTLIWALDCFPPLFRFAPAVSYETKRGDTAKQSDGGRNDGVGQVAG